MIIKCMNLHEWIFISLISLEIPLITSRKLEGYEYPVYTTETCPTSSLQWKARSRSLNCTDKKRYMCIPNDKLTTLLEFCYKDKLFPIEKGICLILNEKTSNVTHYNCSNFKTGCPHNAYWSNEVYKYVECLSIGIGCFNSQQECQKERCPTLVSTEKPRHGSTEVTISKIIPSTTTLSTPNSVCPDQSIAVFQTIILLIIALCACIGAYKISCDKTNCSRILSSCLSQRMLERPQAPENETLLPESFRAHTDTKSTGTCTDEEDYYDWKKPLVKKGKEEREFIVENVHIYLEKGDVTDAKVHAILNSTNKKFDLKEGQVSRKLLEKAGIELQEECFRKALELERNKVVDTEGYKLNRRIIHILCPTKHDRWIERLEKAFERANDLQFRSIAMPLVGTGNANVNFGVKTMCKVIMKSVSKFKPCNGSTERKEVKIVIHDENTFNECYEYFKKVSDRDNAK